MKMAIPSIDLLGGKAVRLRQGRRETAEVLGEPLKLAQKYSQLGFRYLHVVDLDAAFGGSNQFALLKKLSAACGSMKLQWAGGIRSESLAKQALEAGAARVVFGTALFTAPNEVKRTAAKYEAEKVWASLDFSGIPPVAAIKGWTQGTAIGTSKALEAAQTSGVGGIILSSIDADGMMEGPNLPLAKAAASKASLPLWLAGGMRDAQDARAAFSAGAQGAIFGRALYGSGISLEELACLQKE